jgi:hypothetical protein
MYVFSINETVNGVLLPAFDLIERMGLEEVATWRFKELTMFQGHPPGMTLDEFEAASWLPGGFVMPDAEFRGLVRSEFQMRDGDIEGWSSGADARCIVRVTCEDASQWDVCVDDDEIAAHLERAGFIRSSERL